MVKFTIRLTLPVHKKVNVYKNIIAAENNKKITALFFFFFLKKGFKNTHTSYI